MPFPTTALPIIKKLKKKDFENQTPENTVQLDQSIPRDKPPVIPQITPTASVPQPPISFLPTETNRVVKQIVQPDGSIFLDILKPSQQAAEGVPANLQAGLTPEQQAAENQIKRAALIQQLTSEIQKIGQVPEQPLANINTTGVVDVLPEALTKAGAGAAGSAIAGGTAAALGVGATAATGIGAVALGVGATIALNGIISNLKEERANQIKVERRSFSDSAKRLQGIIKGARDGLIDPITAVDLYNWEVKNIYQKETNLKLLDEVKWAKTAKLGLTDIEAFRRGKFQYDQMLADAITKNPNNNFDLSGLDIPQELTAA